MLSARLRLPRGEPFLPPIDIGALSLLIDVGALLNFRQTFLSRFPDAAEHAFDSFLGTSLEQGWSPML